MDYLFVWDYQHEILLTGLAVLTLLLDVDTGRKVCLKFSISELSVSLRVEACVRCL